jgi:glycosyltransferase involved in cell wall biosynthesis
MMWSPLNARHNFMTIHNGLELHKFSAELLQLPKQLARRQLNIADTEVMVLIVGTVCARKGQMDLVEALGRLADEQVEKLHCFIVGDREGEYSKQLHQAHEALSASKRAKIEIIPETQEATLYYAAADIYVGSSRRESFPRVILEAMAAELTIITTPVNGVVEQVRESNALFYQPGDIDVLVAHLNLLLGQPELRRKMATINKYMLERLISYDEMIDAYGDVFRGAWLSGTSRGGTLRGGAARVSVSPLA